MPVRMCGTYMCITWRHGSTTASGTGIWDGGTPPTSRFRRALCWIFLAFNQMKSGMCSYVRPARSCTCACLPACLRGCVVAALEECGRVRRGETVLVTAAAGGTGQFAVQLAKAAGAHVVATCSDADKAALLRRLGADRVVDYKKESLKVRDYYGLKGACPSAPQLPGARPPECKGSWGQSTPRSALVT